MDKTSLEMLNLLKTHDSLNYDQFRVLIRNIGFHNFGQHASYLLKESFIERSDSFISDEEKSQITLNANFKITLRGIQYLENKKAEDKKFKIQSIYVPVLVAFLTSLFTNVLTLWITK